MATSEIEKLERRYAENPNGLTFAPLAEMHRRNGDVARALELLGPGLERYPEYIPARIVLGRCHLDLGDVAEAEQAFTRVIELDGENVIALKTLADINERLVRYDDAERWLRTLLTIDRSNDEAQEQLARLAAARQQMAGSAADPAAEPAGDAVVEPMSELVTASTEPMSELTTAPTEPMPGLMTTPAAAASREAAPDDTKLADELHASTRRADADLGSKVEAEAPVDQALAEIEEPLPMLYEPSSLDEGLETQDEIALDIPVPEVPGLVKPDSVGLREELSREAHHQDDPFRIELADELVLRPSGATEFQVPDASQDLVAVGPEPDPFASHRTTVPEPEVLETPAEAEEAVAESTEGTPLPERIETPIAEIFETPVAEKFAVPEEPVATPILTETMAEVLLQQGHSVDALRIYRELDRRSEGNERIRQKVVALEAKIAEERKPTPAYSARETGGQSVGAFLRDLLAARLTAESRAASHVSTASRVAAEAAVESAAGPGGAPTRPAAASLSLSAVFGEDTPPVLPAVPVGSTPDVSFDDFFGSPGISQGAKASRPKDPDEDDLDQFHSWLQNLKR